MTSPDIDQCTSDSVAKPITSVLSEPASPDSAGREHEGQQLVAVHFIAQRDGARLVLADHLEHLAERRGDDAHDAQEAGHEDRQHHVVHGRVRGERQQAEQLAARHALQAVLAAGERRLQADEEHHLRQRQRDHGEVDALAADGDQPEDQAQQRRCGHAGERCPAPAASPAP